MINISDKARCCGCCACVNACPKHCISMKMDRYGFWFPVVDTKQCIDCGLCEKVCPEISSITIPEGSPKSGCIVRNRDNKILQLSTSGGFFFAMCEYVISQGGVVYGAVLDDNLHVVHKRADDLKSCEAFLGSKYVQSFIGDIFQRVKEDLELERIVCFSGTPCQVQGLIGYLNKKTYKNLILVDFVCHGVPSELVWDAYLDYERKRNKHDITEVQFRSKRYGYQNSTMKIRAGGRDIFGSNRTNAFLKMFFSHIAFRESCYSCPAKTVGRISDFTIFDSWNGCAVLGEKDDDKGYTNVIVQSSKAEYLINQLALYLTIKDVKLDDIIPKTGGMVKNSPTRNPNREEFLEEVITKGFAAAIDHFLRIRKKDHVIEKVKFHTRRIRVIRKLSKIKRKLLRKQ